MHREVAEGGRRTLYISRVARGSPLSVVPPPPFPVSGSPNTGKTLIHDDDQTERAGPVESGVSVASEV